MSWQQAHAPSTSYERLVRSSDIEISHEERSAVRKDIRRSKPSFFRTYAPADFDAEQHAQRLERVLCAWSQYDQEIGYVQAMNLVASTLLLLLDDEETTFWALVTLLRQLPPQFYSRSPLQLLGFWTEVEVLSQLAGRLLALENVRGPLLQISPQWWLEWWLRTIPLPSLVPVGPHAEACGQRRAVVAQLQIGLVSLVAAAQLKSLCASGEMERAFSLLQDAPSPRYKPTCSSRARSPSPHRRRCRRCASGYASPCSSARARSVDPLLLSPPQVLSKPPSATTEPAPAPVHLQPLPLRRSTTSPPL